MRITFLALALAAAGAVWAGSSETATYVDGNLTGISPNSGATLNFDDEHSMTLRTGLSTVAIPYSGISHAELGAVKENSHDAPFYKVWDLPRRLGSKTRTQLLIVNFKNDKGEQKNMTLELAKASAQSTLSTIQNHSASGVVAHSSKKSAAEPAKQASADDDSWWGDKYWKTTSNQDKWSKPAGTNAPDER